METRDRPGSKCRDDLAQKLLLIGAQKSLGPFGWAHPDCEALQEAARILRGEPAQVDTGEAVGNDLDKPLKQKS